ncbi:MAG TPA: peptidoglycan editing factor PgeF [Trueperaceae bacterium]
MALPGAEVPLLTGTGFPAPHGFTTRAGGVSRGHYAALNLGLSSGDDRELVEENRQRVLRQIGARREDVCGYHQVHGTRVMIAAPGWFDEKADAGVSNDPQHVLVVSAADCYPVLFHDPASGAAGAAHCGWRGTLGRLPAEVVATLQRVYGARPEDVRVTIGQGIGGRCYQVDAEVADAFLAAGFPAEVTSDERPPADLERGEPGDGRRLLDVHAAILHALGEAGVLPAHVTSLGLCTHCERDLFFSHRRDAGLTGRMWGFVRPTRPA